MTISLVSSCTYSFIWWRKWAYKLIIVVVAGVHCIEAIWWLKKRYFIKIQIIISGLKKIIIIKPTIMQTVMWTLGLFQTFRAKRSTFKRYSVYPRIIFFFCFYYLLLIVLMFFLVIAILIKKSYTRNKSIITTIRKKVNSKTRFLLSLIIMIYRRHAILFIITLFAA